jgi:hypothetical protein
MLGDKAVLVLGQQQGVAEPGRAARLTLADRPGIRISRHHPIRDAAVAGKPVAGLPSSRPVTLTVCSGWPASRASQPSPGRRAVARWAARLTAATSRRVCRAIPATSPVSRSTSAMVTRVRRRRVWAS